MDPIPALLAVAASYVAYLVGWRRIRVVQGRRRGPDLQALATYDHRALARELSQSVAAWDVTAGGRRLVPIPGRPPLGSLPEPWASAPWAFATPDRLLEVRDLLLLGLPDEAAAAVDAWDDSLPSLFTWAFLVRIFSNESDRALAVAQTWASLQPEGADQGHRLLAHAEALRAENLPPGSEREAAATRGLEHLQRLADPCESPALCGLAAHLEILRLGMWNLEIGEWLVRKRLRKALARHPQAPVLHLVRAHLAASLGDGQRAADHLARALYYARGDAFYAAPIAASPYLSLARPALAAQARAILRAHAEAEGNGPQALSSQPPNPAGD